MQIENFKHDFEEKTITFQIKRNGKTYEMKVEKTDRGTSYTDYYDWTENWSSGEHSQLEDFVDGCSGMLHQFYHY